MRLNKLTDPFAGRSLAPLEATLVVLFAVAFSPNAAMAQELPDQADLEAKLAESLVLATPGSEHARFERMVGEWDTLLTLWPQPGAEPIVVDATTESELILGGRYLVQSTTIPDGFFAGDSITILGFDRRSGEYTLIGLDTMGTYWVTARGPASGEREAVLSGEDFDPVFDGTQEYDFVLRWEDDDTFIMQIIFKDAVHTRGGDPFKMLETVARRR